jgi:predicted phosphoribosyltransferase
MILNLILRHFQIRFKNREAAALTLSGILKNVIMTEERKNTLILAIARGGVVTANIVSKSLSIPNIEIVIPRKLTDPDNKEQAIGAVFQKEVHLLKSVIESHMVTEEYIQNEIKLRNLESEQKYELYDLKEGGILITDKISHFTTILLLDDGIATGATVIVLIKWIQRILSNSGNTKRIIIAAPIAPKNIAQQIRNEYSVEVITVIQPSPNLFGSVEQFHKTFEQIPDENVISLLKKDYS